MNRRLEIVAQWTFIGLLPPSRCDYGDENQGG